MDEDSNKEDNNQLEDENVKIEINKEERLDEIQKLEQPENKKLEVNQFFADLKYTDTTDMEAQDYFKQITQQHYDSLLTQKDPFEKQKKTEMEQSSFEPTGHFSIYFGAKLCGLSFLMDLDYEVKTKGRVETELLYHEWLEQHQSEKGPDNNVSPDKKRKLDNQEGDSTVDFIIDQEGFDLSEIMSFNLYRGEITSAPPEDLAFEVKFDSIDE